MVSRRSVIACLFMGVLLAVSRSGKAWMEIASSSLAGPRSSAIPVRRVNVPYFSGDVRFSETAILWFGRVTPTENAADVRLGYSPEHLYVRVGAFDRRLWYDDTTPSPQDLTDWDAVTLYLDLDGNTGDAPDDSSYRLDAQLVWWESRSNYQAAYQGNGSSWEQTSLSFTTTSGWRGDAPNNGTDDRGWALTYRIPFSELGSDYRPVQATVWGLAVVIHDRDDASGTPIADQMWPEGMSSAQPATWGQLAFGTPTYEPQEASPEGTITVRQGLNGATVVDADVGGSSTCGSSAWPDYFANWGGLNYPDKDFLNIQNLGDIGDWPCFSRAYVTFPIDAIPGNKVIISATLTMYQWGNAGEGYDPGPQPSLIQVCTVAEDWDESTITWNNAPLAVENIAATWAGVFPAWPGEPREWDVSHAVAEAYTTGTPVRLALYESDWAYHSGKYFVSSDSDEWSKERRPTLTISYGRALADIEKSAAPTFGYQGDPVTYTLSLLGTGNPLTLTDTLPVEVDWLGNLECQGTAITPTYNVSQHALLWTDTPSLGHGVVIRYTVTISTSRRQALYNTAEIEEAGGSTDTSTEIVLANPYLSYLPLIFRTVAVP
jgi:hypothetical protein